MTVLRWLLVADENMYFFDISELKLPLGLVAIMIIDD
jgi:hypothetical protein